jgi:hypothetical protein
MPRLSLYRPEKGNDYKFMDSTILEQFMVGGTDVLVHKYLGPIAPNAENQSPATPVNSNPIPELGIQDLLLLENRDRQYDTIVYVMRGIYNMQQLDFSLNQFGLFLANDQIFVHFHLNDTVRRLGRKIMAGDVIELPHLADPYALSDATVALKRFYVVDDVLRPSEGFSATWYPHLVRAKCKPLINSQEFSQLLSQDVGVSNTSDYAPVGSGTLADLMSNYNQSMAINDAVQAQAAADVDKSGYFKDHLWMVPVKDKFPGSQVFTEDVSLDISSSTEETSSMELDASLTLKSPNQDYIVGYLTGDGTPPNGQKLLGLGAQFPSDPFEGAFYLRTDYLPNRLFRYDGYNWITFDSNIRMTMNNLTKQNQMGTFVNNSNVTHINGKHIDERQPLSKLKDITSRLTPDN